MWSIIWDEEWNKFEVIANCGNPLNIADSQFLIVILFDSILFMAGARSGLINVQAYKLHIFWELANVLGHCNNFIFECSHCVLVEATCKHSTVLIVRSFAVYIARQVFLFLYLTKFVIEFVYMHL